MDYKNFDIENFRAELYSNNDKEEVYCYSGFHENFTSLLYKSVPIKNKILRHNNNPYMTKTLRKAIMLRSKLKNKHNKTRSTENWDNYKQQRNFCVNLLLNTKRSYFGNLNLKNISDNSKLWKTINNNLLLEKDDLIKNERQIVKKFNEHFVNVASKVKLRHCTKS